MKNFIIIATLVAFYTLMQADILSLNDVAKVTHGGEIAISIKQSNSKEIR